MQTTRGSLKTVDHLCLDLEGQMKDILPQVNRVKRGAKELKIKRYSMTFKQVRGDGAPGGSVG